MDLLRQRAYNLRWATQPEDVIPLTAADPDFPVAPEIREAIQAYAGGGVMGYGPPEGLPEFRETVARVVQERHNLPCTPDLVFPTDSAAAAMFLIARTVCSPGDEAILFDPVDFLFGQSLDAAGVRGVYLPINRQRGTFDIDQLAGLVTPLTRMLCLCNPHNPLGRVFTREELMGIGQLAVEHDLMIMSDEVWCDIIYPPHQHISIGSLDPEIGARTVTVFGPSKGFGIAGLRIGFLVAPDAACLERLTRFSLEPLIIA
jgi:aminotransferase